MSSELNSVDKNKMGVRIRGLREDAHMSREELSKELGISSHHLAEVEYGNKGISLDVFYKLRQVFNVSSDYLLDGDVSMMSEDAKRRRLQENILAMTSVCSIDRLTSLQEVVRHYTADDVRKRK